MKHCSECDALNPISSEKCQACATDFGHDFEVSLNDALRVGAIVRGMDIDEDETQLGETIKHELVTGVLNSGDDQLIRIIRQLPEESYGRLAKILSYSD